MCASVITWCPFSRLFGLVPIVHLELLHNSVFGEEVFDQCFVCAATYVWSILQKYSETLVYTFLAASEKVSAREIKGVKKRQKSFAAGAIRRSLVVALPWSTVPAAEHDSRHP